VHGAGLVAAFAACVGETLAVGGGGVGLRLRPGLRLRLGLRLGPGLGPRVGALAVEDLAGLAVTFATGGTSTIATRNRRIGRGALAIVQGASLVAAVPTRTGDAITVCGLGLGAATLSVEETTGQLVSVAARHGCTLTIELGRIHLYALVLVDATRVARVVGTRFAHPVAVAGRRLGFLEAAAVVDGARLTVILAAGGSRPGTRLLAGIGVDVDAAHLVDLAGLAIALATSGAGTLATRARLGLAIGAAVEIDLTSGTVPVGAGSTSPGAWSGITFEGGAHRIV